MDELIADLPLSLLVYSPTLPSSNTRMHDCNLLRYLSMCFPPPKNYDSVHQTEFILFVERKDGRKRINHSEVHRPTSSLSLIL